eukprot:Nitzschia sp. Nitz4//scaffold211_size37880//19190//20459//NITZ4_007707-RA/size37880-augustus-gene-0.54-mRNA-1//1//CDS//3329541982//1909//frame0
MLPCCRKNKRRILHVIHVVVLLVGFLSCPSADAFSASFVARLIPRTTDYVFSRKHALQAVPDNIPRDIPMNHGILLSSFTQGLKENPRAIDFLMKGLVSSLLSERSRSLEFKVAQSALQSPCCGPNLKALAEMELADEERTSLEKGRHNWQTSLLSLIRSNPDSEPIHLRLLYIPTALYAYRPSSTTPPGKQRRRAKADGSSRRRDIVSLLRDRLGSAVNIHSVTLDLNDASLHHYECTARDTHTVTKDGPKNGRDAMRGWAPHLIYVEGGNTFWLQHCIEKGDWEHDWRNLVMSARGSVYCGTSAGAIVAGQSVQTACWKQWDDPSIVPGRETYDDWKAVKGLGLVKNVSFFPHMDVQWESIVEEKASLLQGSTICCIQEADACLVHPRGWSIVSSTS